MASPTPHSTQLSEIQQLALETLTSVTNQEPSEAIPLLQRSEWNVQVSTGHLFGQDPKANLSMRLLLRSFLTERPLTLWRKLVPLLLPLRRLHKYDARRS